MTAGKTAFGGSYSTSEVNTGFTWIDGKPIYKKTINMGNGPNNTTKDVTHSVTGINQIVFYYGVSGSQVLPVASSLNTTLIETIRVNTTLISWRSTYDATGNVGYVTMLYTKT